jgi:hypothetical protein
MIWTLYIAAAVLLVGSIYCSTIAFDFSSPYDGLAFAGMIVLGFAALSCALIPTIVLPSRYVGSTNCRNWSQQTGYPSKFRVLNWFDTGQCLARTPDGHWTLNTNIIVNVPAKP